VQNVAVKILLVILLIHYLRGEGTRRTLWVRFRTMLTAIRPIVCGRVVDRSSRILAFAAIRRKEHGDITAMKTVPMRTRRHPHQRIGSNDRQGTCQTAFGPGMCSVSVLARMCVGCPRIPRPLLLLGDLRIQIQPHSRPEQQEPRWCMMEDNMRRRRRLGQPPDFAPVRQSKERCAAFPRCTDFICDTAEPVTYAARRGPDLKFCSASCLRHFLGVATS
jgi:hypothetical protein